jgi:isocitrate/isopropylmalate dehydrogenase
LVRTVAWIKGDGTGPELTEGTLKVLKAVNTEAMLDSNGGRVTAEVPRLFQSLAGKLSIQQMHV